MQTDAFTPDAHCQQRGDGRYCRRELVSVMDSTVPGDPTLKTVSL